MLRRLADALHAGLAWRAVPSSPLPLQDFFEMFAALRPLLNQDPTLYCISG